jgi:hypothetical protein
MKRLSARIAAAEGMNSMLVLRRRWSLIDTCPLRQRRLAINGPRSSR